MLRNVLFLLICTVILEPAGYKKGTGKVTCIPGFNTQPLNELNTKGLVAYCFCMAVLKHCLCLKVLLG